MIETIVFFEMGPIDELKDKLHSWVEYPNATRMDYELRCKNCGAVKLTSEQVHLNNYLKEHGIKGDLPIPPTPRWCGAKYQVFLPSGKTYHV